MDTIPLKNIVIERLQAGIFLYYHKVMLHFQKPEKCLLEIIGKPSGWLDCLTAILKDVKPSICQDGKTLIRQTVKKDSGYQFMKYYRQGGENEYRKNRHRRL